MTDRGLGSHTSPEYRRARRQLLASGPVCVWCKERAATQADHVPALSTFPDRSLWVGELVPACQPCNSRRGAREVNRRKNLKTSRRW